MMVTTTMRKVILAIFAVVCLMATAQADEGRTEVTRHALATPAAAEQSVTALAAYLAQTSFSPEDRAWAIFVWIGDRIDYDIDAYLAGRSRDLNVTADEVLKRRRTVCDGFAALYNALARSAGLESTIVQGYAKGYGLGRLTFLTEPNHAWVIIRPDGQWRTVDPTWGAGYVFADRYVKQRDPLFYFTPASTLKFTHWPVDASLRQSMGLTLTKGQFESQVSVDPGLFRAGIHGDAISAVIAEPGFNGLVEVFEQNHRGLKVIELPLRKRLRSGQAYRLHLLASAFDDIVVMHGDGIISLRRQGDAFVGEIYPGSGNMLIAGRPKGDGRLTGLFQYLVE